MLPALLLVAACQPDSTEPSTVEHRTAADRPAINALDVDTAERRKARINGLQYELYVDIASSPERYTGEAVLRFELVDASAPLTIDFAGGSVDALTVNGAAVDAGYNDCFITIPADALTAGPTEIRIAYAHPFSNDGTGLHRFTDPEDGLSYLYTYLWPYNANQLLPAFDQPNLKAPFTLKVLAPADWVVVSAAPGTPASAENGLSLWTFSTTPKIATYMFSLHAGPYRVWESDAAGVPLRLLARQSLAEYVPAREWLETTRGGFAFYGKYFDIPYPFEKYDQVIAPESTIGGMENVAAVTFSEQYVQRQESDRNQREHRTNVVLHELAHMWFGDLVTHEWWNGMWLNESFAELMAAVSLGQVTEFTDIWHGFLINEKSRAFARDSRVTTHPIEMPINSTNEFHKVWDAITYQKGASVLRQLQHYVGEDNFRNGVSAYLKANRWGNTTLADFIGHQEQSAGRSLDDWTKDWLLTAGFNTLGAEVDCDGGTISTLAITQSAPPAYPTLRTHSIDVALYGDDGNGALAAASIQPVTIRGSRSTVDSAAGAPCPVIVNPNQGDWTLAQLALSDDDVTVLNERLGDIADPMSRSIFLAALYDRAIAGAMPLADYLDLAIRLADREQNLRVLEQVTTTVAGVTDLMQRLRPQTDAALARQLPAIEETSLRHTRTAATRDLGLMWFNLFLDVVDTDSGIETVRALLDGKEQITGIEFSPELRWTMLIILSGHGVDGIDGLLAAERAGDPSDFGTKRLLTARAAAPDAANKAGWLAELQTPAKITGLDGQRAVMDGLFPATQTQFQLALLGDILAALPGLAGQRESYFLSSYTETLLQPMCREESVALMQAALDEHGAQLDATTLRFLREAHQADEECLALRSVQ